LRHARIILFNAATLLSTLLVLATGLLWVRSPSVFDRLSFTDRSSNLWEFTSIWGDLAIVRADSWPVSQSTRWQSFPLGHDRFFPVADCEPLFTRDSNNVHLEEWGRGFSQQSGVVTAEFEQLEQRFFRRRFARWTLPCHPAPLVAQLLGRGTNPLEERIKSQPDRRLSRHHLLRQFLAFWLGPPPG
jgi:hypothetical protein